MQSLLKLVITHPTFLHYYQISCKSSTFEDGFTSLFVPAIATVSVYGSNNATTTTSPNNSNSGDSNSSSSSSSNTDNQSALTYNQLNIANKVEEWLLTLYTGMCRKLLSCIATNKPQHIHRTLLTYINQCKRDNNLPRTVLSTLQTLHVDVILQCLYELMQINFLSVLNSQMTVTNSIAGTSGDYSVDRELTSSEMDYEFISFVGFGIFDLTRIIKQHQDTPRRTQLLAVFTALRGTRELLAGTCITCFAFSIIIFTFCYKCICRVCAHGHRAGRQRQLHIPTCSITRLGTSVATKYSQYGQCASLEQLLHEVNVRNHSTRYIFMIYSFFNKCYFITVHIVTDEELKNLFTNAFVASGLVPELLPSTVTISAVQDALTLKIYHARCGAIFSQLSSVLQTKSSVSLRGGLKALSALKKSAADTKKKSKKSNKEGGMVINVPSVDKE